MVYLANQFVGPESRRVTYDEALASARQGVELAPGLAYTQVTLAATMIYAHHDFAGAKQAFARAKAEGAGDATVLLGYGLFTCELGNCEAGASALRRAATLDPLNPVAYKTLGSALIGARRYLDAIAALRKALALSPNTATAHASIGNALLLRGDLAGAKAEYAAEPLGWARRTGQAMVLRRLGDDAGARAALGALIADDADGSAYQEAQIYAQWGDRDRAFSALDMALRLNDPGLAMVRVDPLLDPLRADPRLAGRLARTGLAG